MRTILLLLPTGEYQNAKVTSKLSLRRRKKNLGFTLLNAVSFTIVMATMQLNNPRYFRMNGSRDGGRGAQETLLKASYNQKRIY